MKINLSLILFLAIQFSISNCHRSIQKINSSEMIIQPWPDNPHYLALGETPVFPLGPAGFHSWTPISRPENIDFHEQFDRLAQVIKGIGSPHVCGFVRIIPYDPMNHDHDGAVKRVLQPWIKLEDGRYDLEQFSEEWEKRLRNYLSAAFQHRIVVSLEIWDDWSITRGLNGASDPGENSAWNAHPFNPENNFNYDNSFLPVQTAHCNAPFYSTIPSLDNNEKVLELQKRYVDKVLSIASEYPNIIINITNESRAHLKWSRFWATYIRQRIPQTMMIGEMPSTNRKDSGGECEYEFNPLTLCTDPLYDFVDISQAVSTHEFGADPKQQAIGGGEYILKYRQAMIMAETPRPLIVSKDYTRGPNGGDIILWGRFVSGAASARFHRLHFDHHDSVSQFQHDAVGRLGRFIAKVPFWRMHPTIDLVKELPSGAGINVLAEPGHCYVVQLIGGDDNDKLQIDLPLGIWTVRWLDPATGLELAFYEINSNIEEVELDIPSGPDHRIILIERK